MEQALNRLPATLDTKQVAELFCVSQDTVRAWRSDAYNDSPLKLIGRRVGHNGYVYDWDTLEEFVHRNPKYRLEVLRLTSRKTSPQFRGVPIYAPLP
jgi:hypothetical protein